MSLINNTKNFIDNTVLTNKYQLSFYQAMDNTLVISLVPTLNGTALVNEAKYFISSDITIDPQNANFVIIKSANFYLELSENNISEVGSSPIGPGNTILQAIISAFGL